MTDDPRSLRTWRILQRMLRSVRRGGWDPKGNSDAAGTLAEMALIFSWCDEDSRGQDSAYDALFALGGPQHFGSGSVTMIRRCFEGELDLVPIPERAVIEVALETAILDAAAGVELRVHRVNGVWQEERPRGKRL